MTVAGVVQQQDNGLFDCDGAQVRAQHRHLATVVRLRGEIGAANVHRLRAHLQRFTRDESPVILDLTGVDVFAAVGVSLLSAFDGDCRGAGVEWTLVATPAVAEAVRGSAVAGAAQAASVPDALRARADAVARLRRLVTPLVRRPA
ncbi:MULTISPECIES: STAS domain-containing protein [unclassified Mycobacterium]|uniref:STAS domain-containing protein n=1 Tax=unclassified Mycobacterium TaxID=2642494 RepID=UPI0007FBF0DF|nr:MULTISPECIES: STAS domain-containing protein [unclassified Mycobacterium]OBG71109.1 hypothetical protein A5700_13100 [Mycobacterium sp. E1214]OBH23412.1 hypothetical protein A5693_11225 [Mycobacterium sp. E1319]